MKKQTDKSKQIDFGDYLKELRLAAGYISLSDAVLAASKTPYKNVKLSKAKLSLYERGQVDTIKPEALQLLATIYNISYAEISRRWFFERYGGLESDLTLSAYDIRLPLKHELSIKIENQSISLISLSQFELLQSRVPPGTQILISSNRFLDDTIYYKMVLKNIKRDVRYLYLLPESQRMIYRHLSMKLAHDLSKTKIKKITSATTFVPRSDFDSPVNQAIFIYPNGEIQGFVGLVIDESPLCFQVVEQQMSVKLFHSFIWMLRIATNSSTSSAIKKLETYYAQSRSKEEDTISSLIEELNG